MAFQIKTGCHTEVRKVDTGHTGRGGANHTANLSALLILAGHVGKIWEGTVGQLGHSYESLQEPFEADSAVKVYGFKLRRLSHLTASSGQLSPATVRCRYKGKNGVPCDSRDALKRCYKETAPD